MRFKTRGHQGPGSRDLGTIGAIGRGTGYGIYYAIHRSHMRMGRVVSGARGLALRKRGGQRTYALAGNIATFSRGSGYAFRA